MAGVVERRGWTERVWIQSKGTRGGTKWGEGVLERRFGCAGGVESLRGGGPDSHKPLMNLSPVCGISDDRKRLRTFQAPR